MTSTNRHKIIASGPRPIENNIRRLRELNGESIQDLADAVGVSRSTVSKWETRTRTCPEPFKRRIARHYGWPTHAIFLFDSSVASDTLIALAKAAS